MKRAIPLAFGAGLAGAWLMSVCWGSVDIPLGDTLRVLWNALLGRPIPQGLPGAILLDVRLPRTLCVALVGAALSLAGAAMQGLLRNPLADGSTLGVASGASLGAVLAIALGVQLPGGGDPGPQGLGGAEGPPTGTGALAGLQRPDQARPPAGGGSPKPV